MAEHATRRRSTGQSGSDGAWTPQRIADALVPRRDRFVERLARELPGARGLTADQCELVVDEAIDFMVTEYARPIEDLAGLERVFWATAAFRIKRVHEGRGATVRAGWQRVDLDGVELPAAELDPQAAVVARAEREALLEFAATLTESERQVLVCKYREGPRELGRIAISRRLSLPIGEVRRAERSIIRKLERFAAIMAAGTLCAHRDPAIGAFAAGVASDAQVLAARVHLHTCPACRAAYNERLRSGEFARKLAELLPAPPLVAGTGRRRGAWEALVEWAGRPFASDSASTAVHSMAAGGGRGLGAAAAAKLATICLAGAAAVGGGAYCVQNGLLNRAEDRSAPARAAERPDITDPTPVVPVASTTSRELRSPARPQPSPATARKPRNAASHETDVPISPAPPGARPNGASEFELDESAAATQTQPAPAPAGGGPEFP
jgi:hypothetical protein